MLWAHNDGGPEDVRVALIAFDASGRHLGDFALVNAVNEDWEDIAVAVEPDGTNVIYVADIGDNDRARESIRLIRVEEPDVAGGSSAVVSHAEIELRYPDGRAHNAESMAVDPTSGDVLIFTKRNRDDPDTEVFRARAPLTDERTHTLQRVAIESEDAPLDARFVAADISADGLRMIAQIDDGDTQIWTRHPAEPLAAALLWPRVVTLRPSCRSRPSHSTTMVAT